MFQFFVLCTFPKRCCWRKSIPCFLMSSSMMAPPQVLLSLLHLSPLDLLLHLSPHQPLFIYLTRVPPLLLFQKALFLFLSLSTLALVLLCSSHLCQASPLLYPPPSVCDSSPSRSSSAPPLLLWFTSSYLSSFCGASVLQRR